MPIRPSIQTLQANTPQILNAIRNDLGGTYADTVPKANDTVQSIQAVGKKIMEYDGFQNSFVSALMNRIALTIVTSKAYTNPWNMFKKGKLDFGETIEEIFVGMAEPFQFDADDAEQTVFKQAKPDLSTAFHRLNFAKLYETTIRDIELRQAFLSMSGVTDLISRCIQQLYTGMEYDEFLMMKYLLAKTALQGKIYATTIPAVTNDNLADIVTDIKTMSNNFEYMSTNYNMANVTNFSKKDSQYIILTSSFESNVDVKVLSSAFNMDKAEFFGHRVPVDSFANLDVPRLKKIFKNMGDSFVPFTDAEITELETINCMIVDKDFFMIFDNFQETNNIRNPKGLYYNYFLHVWKTFSVSPFANAVLFTTITPSITSVAVSPTTISMGKGTKVMLVATVDNVGFANNEVTWSVNSDNSVVTPDGQLTVGANEVKTTLTVTATSKFDKTKTATSTITVE